MNESLKTETLINCRYVKAGVKPTSSIASQNRYVDSIVYIAAEEGLHGHCEYLSDEWTTIWVYKHEFLKNVIKQMPNKPKTDYDHWVLGKAFGYSDEAIGDFIDKGYHM